MIVTRNLVRDSRSSGRTTVAETVQRASARRKREIAASRSAVAALDEDYRAA
jgi:hypothetical protein